MKIKSTYIFSLLAIIAMLAGCSGGGGRKLPSLEESYSKNDKKPFGANIAYRQVEAMYNDNVVQVRKKDFKDTWENISDTGALYICLAPKLYLAEEEVTAMMEYVEAGNSLFVSSALIDQQLLDEMGCNESYNAPELDRMIGEMGNASVNSVAQPEEKYGYYYYPFQNYFTGIDSTNTRILGYNADKRPNLVVYFRGKGKLYLQCDPRAYSNYFLLKDNNYQHLKNTLAFTESRPQHVYWDDYYYKLRSRKNSNRNFSSLAEIMKNPPLKNAFLLALLLLALYILFGGKRIQRIIPQLKPNENTSVTFTETIGRLYLQKKDNKNIADKMITYFNEYIRNTYFVNTNHVNDDFVVLLSRKSGVDKDKVETLYRTIVATQGSAVVNDYQLLSLQEQIQNFYKNKN
ncbi:MAG: DUF4350 domain-containing protein [Ferruginibacter sp.]